MTTIVNSPTPPNESGGNGLLVGGIIFIGLLVVFMYIGIPTIRRMNPPQMTIPTPQVNVAAPQINMPAPQINVQAPQIPVATP